MDNSKEQSAGKFIRFKIPEDLHKLLRIDSITSTPKKNLDVVCTEYIKLGYETHHKNLNSGTKNKNRN